MRAILLGILAVSATPAVHARPALKVTSTLVKPGSLIEPEQVYNGFGCTGGNVSPDLSWSGALVGTKTFAVTVFDPDAPTGHGWWHWTVFNIPVNVTSLSAGAGSRHSALPVGALQGRTDFGTLGYGGPCPPAGRKSHRYIFTVYALKDSIPLGEGAPSAKINTYANRLKIAEGSLTAIYRR